MGVILLIFVMLLCYAPTMAFAEEPAETATELIEETVETPQNPTEGTPAAAGDILVDAINFPDDAFREWVSTNVDTDGTGSLSEEERNKVTVMSTEEGPIGELPILPVLPLTIKDLSGIQNFTQLSDLDCYGIDITELRLDGLTQLKRLVCSETGIETLDLSSVRNLAYLDCRSAGIKTLKDLNGLRNLTYLDCSDNPIKELDLRDLEQLDLIYCYDTDIETLDLSDLKNLTFLDCSGTDIKKLDLHVLEKLDWLNCSNTGIETLDLSDLKSLTGLSCSNTGITELDLSGVSNLTRLVCYGTGITELNLNGLSNLEELYCGNTEITELDLSGVSNLKYLDCSNTGIEDLDLKGLSLISLYCSDTGITKLDLDVSILGWLWCDNTGITELALDGAEYLGRLSCYNTGITELDLRDSPQLEELWYGPNLFALHLPSLFYYLDFFEPHPFYEPITVSLPAGETRYDLRKSAPLIEADHIQNLSGATLDGTTLTGLKAGQQVSYEYDCGNDYMLPVTIAFQWESGSSPAPGPSIPWGSTPSLPSTSTPSIQTPSITGDDAQVEWSQSGDGSTLTITPKDGYVIEDVTVNGVSKGAVDKLEGLKTGDVVVIKTAKQAQAPTKEEIKAGVEATSLSAHSELTKKGIRIEWEREKGYKVDYYEVFRSTKKNSGYGKTPYYQTKDGDKTSYVNTKGLKKGTRYYYKVRGVRLVDGEKVYTKSTKAWRLWKK